MALWCAPSFPALFMSPGAHGAPARLPVGSARGQEHASVKKRMAALPVMPPWRQRAATCHRVRVCQLSMLKSSQHALHPLGWHSHIVLNIYSYTVLNGFSLFCFFNTCQSSIFICPLSPSSGLFVEWMVPLERVQCYVWWWVYDAEQDSPKRARTWWGGLCWTVWTAHCL